MAKERSRRCPAQTIMDADDTGKYTIPGRIWNGQQIAM